MPVEYSYDRDAKGALQYGISRMLQTLYELHDAEYPTQVVANDEELQDAIQEMTKRG